MPKSLGRQEAEQVPLDLDPAANDILERLPEHRELVPERVRARAPKPLVTDEQGVHARLPPGETHHEEKLVPAYLVAQKNSHAFSEMGARLHQLPLIL